MLFISSLEHSKVARHHVTINYAHLILLAPMFCIQLFLKFELLFELLFEILFVCINSSSEVKPIMGSLSVSCSIWATARRIPIDMAGFAVNLRLILTRPEVWIGRDVHGEDSKVGQLETNFLEHFTSREKLECRGSNSEVGFTFRKFWEVL